MSYQLSTNKHFKSASFSPSGAGSDTIICSRISSIPSPVFPEQGMAFSVSIPITSSICVFVFSKSDAVNQFYLRQGLSHAWYLMLDKHLPMFVPLLPECYQQSK